MKTGIKIIGLWALAALLMTLISLSSCEFLTPELPSDWVGWHPVDTVQVDTVAVDTSAIVEDTCEAYAPIASPHFVSFFVNKDVLPTTLIWMVFRNGQNEMIDPVAYFSQYGVTHLYLSGINKGGTITGDISASQFNGRVWCQDLTGTHYHLVFMNEYMHFRGALIFFQFMDELKAHPHPAQIRFTNTGYSFEEINQVLDFLLEGCKSVPTKIYLTATGFPFDPEKIAELEARGATII